MSKHLPCSLMLLRFDLHGHLAEINKKAKFKSGKQLTT